MKTGMLLMKSNYKIFRLTGKPPYVTGRCGHPLGSDFAGPCQFGAQVAVVDWDPER